MTKIETCFNNKKGLHARPATILCKEASQFKSTIKLICGDKQSNAKSLIGLLAMGLRAGTKLEVIAEGTDEEIAAKYMADFIQDFQE